MPLSICEACGEPLDSRFSACPGCGCKLRLSQRIGPRHWFAGLLAVAAFVYLFAMSAFFAQGIELLY